MNEMFAVCWSPLTPYRCQNKKKKIENVLSFFEQNEVMQKELDKLCCKSHILYRNKTELQQLFLNTRHKEDSSLNTQKIHLFDSSFF